MTADAAPDMLPVLLETRDHLLQLLDDGEIDPDELVMTIMADPAFALRVLQYANTVPHSHFRAELSTLDGAIRMLGTRTVQTLAREARQLPDEWDESRLLAYRNSLGRAALAAMFATDWAMSGCDMFPGEVALAALLKPLGEFFLLAKGDRRIGRYLHLVHQYYVFPQEAEYVSLGESLEEVGYCLARQWQLPEMVRESMRPRNARHERTLDVMLALQVAHYASSGWSHPRQCRDLQLVARLLEVPLDILVQRINQTLDAFNTRRNRYQFPFLQPLPDPALDVRFWQESESLPPCFCLSPRMDDLLRCERSLRERGGADRQQLIGILLRGLYRGVGLNRVLFLVYDKRQLIWRASAMLGTEYEPSFNRLALTEAEHKLLDHCADTPSPVWLRVETLRQPEDRTRQGLLEKFGVTGCFVMPLHNGKETAGLLYADRRHADCQLDVRSYRMFQHLVKVAGKALSGKAQDSAPGR